MEKKIIALKVHICNTVTFRGKESGLKTKVMTPHHRGHKYPQTLVMYMQKLQFKSNVINWTSRIFLLTHTYVIIIFSKKLNRVFTSSPSTHSLAIRPKHTLTKEQILTVSCLLLQFSELIKTQQSPDPIRCLLLLAMWLPTDMVQYSIA